MEEKKKRTNPREEALRTLVAALLGGDADSYAGHLDAVTIEHAIEAADQLENAVNTRKEMVDKRTAVIEEQKKEIERLGKLNTLYRDAYRHASYEAERRETECLRLEEAVTSGAIAHAHGGRLVAGMIDIKGRGSRNALCLSSIEEIEAKASPGSRSSHIQAQLGRQFRS